MSSELTSKDKYIYITKTIKDVYTDIYDLIFDFPVIINGKKNIAKNVKIGDNISFIDYSFAHRKTIEHNFEVKDVKYSIFPACCFTGDCLIKTTSGLVHVNTLQIGDTLEISQGYSSQIKCILKTKINQQFDMMVHPNGLVITGYHPVKINDKWCFPNDSDSFEKQSIYVDYIYSIGLENGISFYVNGIEVIGLAHQVYDDEILSHPYFGSNLIIDDIFKLAPDGYCVIVPEQIIRNYQTGLVCGIVNL